MNEKEMEAEVNRISELLDSSGCSCHMHPPCSFCMNLVDDEIGLDQRTLRNLLLSKLSDIEEGL